MKKLIGNLFALLMVAALGISCGDDDKTGLDLPQNPTNYGTLQQLQGTWASYTADKSIAIAVDFFSDMTGGYGQYVYNTSTGNYDRITVNSFRYSYDASTGRITLIIDGNILVWKVRSLSSGNITFEDNSGIVYYGTRYNDSTEETNASDWAPSDVSGYHFKGGIYSSPITGTLDFYFDNNSTLNVASTIVGDLNQYVVHSAEYRKTGTNKAKITFSYSVSGSLSSPNTATVYLTFFSEGFGGGSATESGNGVSSNFTLTRESPNAPQAPNSIAYKKFTPDDHEWFQFGSQSGSNVTVSSFRLVANTDCFDVSATYTKNSNGTATLKISEITHDTFKAPDSEYYTYTLTFTSATEGNYSCYKESTNRYFHGSTFTGRFKLE